MDHILALINGLEKQHLQHKKETEKFKEEIKQQVASLNNTHKKETAKFKEEIKQQVASLNKTIKALREEIKILRENNSKGEKDNKNNNNNVKNSSNDNKLEKYSFEKSPVTNKEQEENNLTKLRKKSKVKENVEPNGSKDIWDAIRRGLIPAIEFWLKRDEALLKHNRRPMHWAVEHGHLPLLKFFVEVKGQELEDKEPLSHLTPLHLACIYGHLDIVKYLLDKGADLEAKSTTEETPLHQAAFHGHLQVVEHLVSKGANTKHLNKLNKTPYETAEGAQRPEVVAFLNNLTKELVDKTETPILNKY